MAEPVRHRQTKGAATDMFDLPPPRHTSTLPLTDFGYALSSSAFDKYMTQIVDPILQWHIGSREPLGGWQAHPNLGALLLQGQKDRGVAIGPAALDRFDHFCFTECAQTHRRVRGAREFLR